VTHGRGSERETGEWSGYPLLFALPRNMVYPALLPLMRIPQLPVVDWTDAPADLNGFVRFAERQNLVSARAPSHFKSSLPSFPRCAWFYYSVQLYLFKKQVRSFVMYKLHWNSLKNILQHRIWQRRVNFPFNHINFFFWGGGGARILSFKRNTPKISPMYLGNKGIYWFFHGMQHNLCFIFHKMSFVS